MCAGSSRTARDTQNIPLVVPEQSIAPLKEILKRSLPASYHLADREVLQFLFSLPKKPILEGASPLTPTKSLNPSIRPPFWWWVWAPAHTCAGHSAHWDAAAAPLAEQD